MTIDSRALMTSGLHSIVKADLVTALEFCIDCLMTGDR